MVDQRGNRWFFLGGISLFGAVAIYFSNSSQSASSVVLLRSSHSVGFLQRRLARLVNEFSEVSSSESSKELKSYVRSFEKSGNRKVVWKIHQLWSSKQYAAPENANNFLHSSSLQYTGNSLDTWNHPRVNLINADWGVVKTAQLSSSADSNLCESRDEVVAMLDAIIRNLSHTAEGVNATLEWLAGRSQEADRAWVALEGAFRDRQTTAEAQQLLERSEREAYERRREELGAAERAAAAARNASAAAGREAEDERALIMEILGLIDTLDRTPGRPPPAAAATASVSLASAEEAGPAGGEEARLLAAVDGVLARAAARQGGGGGGGRGRGPRRRRVTGLAPYEESAAVRQILLQMLQDLDQRWHEAEARAAAAEAAAAAARKSLTATEERLVEVDAREERNEAFGKRTEGRRAELDGLRLAVGGLLAAHRLSAGQEGAAEDRLLQLVRRVRVMVLQRCAAAPSNEDGVGGTRPDD